MPVLEHIPDLEHLPVSEHMPVLEQKKRNGLVIRHGIYWTISMLLFSTLRYMRAPPIFCHLFYG